MARDKYKDLQFADKESDDFKQAVEELVDIVVSQPDTRSYSLEDDVENFILDTGIKAGTVVIPAFFVYYEYLLWSGVNLEDKNELPKYMYEEFFARFSKRYKKKRMTMGVAYRLNKDIFGKYPDMTTEEIKKIKDITTEYQIRLKGSKTINRRTDVYENNDFQELSEEKEKSSEKVYEDSEEEGETE